MELHNAHQNYNHSSWEERLRKFKLFDEPETNKQQSKSDKAIFTHNIIAKCSHDRHQSNLQANAHNIQALGPVQDSSMHRYDNMYDL